MLNPRLDLLTDYPFQRLTALLKDAPGAEPVVMSIGEPQNRPPSFVSDILAQQSAGWGKYPPMNGTPDLRAAIAAWLRFRFELPETVVDPDRHIIPVCGTREGLFQIAQLVAAATDSNRPPVVLLPNPFYQVYAGAALLAGAEPVFVPATRDNGFLPDFSAVPEDILNRAALAYLCTPANPQGAVATDQRIDAAVTLARRHGFVLAVDECYSEIYDHGVMPGSALQSCQRLGGGFDNVVIFHSLSKRSSAPGLRSGFVAGDARLIAGFSRLRAYGGAAMPLPIQAASAALWRDEEHVEVTRAQYRAKIDAAQRIFDDRLGFYRPQGGFFLWLDVGDGEAAALKLWKQAGIRVLPGAYLARAGHDGVNPGRPYIRVALVHDQETTVRALRRMAEVLAED